MDKETNHISLFDVLEQAKVEVVPVGRDERDEPGIVPIPCQVVTMWVRDDFDQPESGVFRLELQGERESFQASERTKVNLEEYVRHRHTVRLPGVPLHRGTTSRRVDFSFRVFQEFPEGERLVADVPFNMQVEVLPASDTK